MSRLTDYLGQLDKETIDRRLSEIEVGEKHRQKIHQLFRRMDSYNSPIYFEPYLKLLVDFLKDEPDKDFTRPKFYKYAIDQQIPDERLRVKLQKIAASFELLQVNGLPEEGFDQLLSEYGWNRDVVNFNTLLNNSLLKIGPDKNDQNDKHSKVQFFHHSIQEYLAYEYINNQSEWIEKLEELVLVMEGEKRAIKPSWYNVIRFFIESEPAEGGKTPIIDLLIEMGNANNDVIDDLYSDTLTSLNVSRVSDEIRDAIFNLIYNTYRERLLWISLWSRDPLSKIITKSTFAELNKDISEPEGGWLHDRQKYVYKGLVAELVGGVLESQPNIITAKEKTEWKKKLIEFALDKNDNGVLQRNALTALTNYKTDNEDENVALIGSVSDAFNTNDELVQQVFLQFVSNVAPNSPAAIDCAVQGIERDSLTIYGRYALYKISSKEGILYFLHQLAENPDFLYKFLDHESIFNDRGREADKVLIEVMDKNLDEGMVRAMKGVIKAAYDHPNIWHEDNSYFLMALVDTFHSQDSNYPQEILEQISHLEDETKRRRLFSDYIGLLSRIITPDDLQVLFDTAQKINEKHGQRIAESIVFAAKQGRDKAGEGIYNTAISKGLMKPYDSDKQQTQLAREPTKDRIIKKFQRLLEPEHGKYMPRVFRFYVDNFETLKGMEREEERLHSLLCNSALTIDPRNFKIKFTDKSTKSFSASSNIDLYGEALRAAQKLGMDKGLQDIRQNIINFIPFAVGQDQYTVQELVGTVSDKELEQFVNRIYLDRTNDTRYFIPSSYIYFIKDQREKDNKLESAIPVLRDFIDNGEMEFRYRHSALETLGMLTPANKEWQNYYWEIFNEAIREGGEDWIKLAEISNSILIQQYQDQKAVEWRFQQLIDRVAPFEEPPSHKVHRIGPLEEEFDSLTFAQPLIKIASTDYISYYEKLIKKGFELLDTSANKQLDSYAKYLWKIVIESSKIIGRRDYAHIRAQLELILAPYEKHPEFNWWNYYLARMRDQSRIIGKFSDFTEVVTTLTNG